jgi:hypothetical protein
MGKVILISGKMGSGKSTLQNTLLQKIFSGHKGLVGVGRNFADPLYEMHDFCRGVLRESGIPFDDTKKDRVLLQFLGTEWGRKTISEDVWVKALQYRIIKDSARYSKMGLESVHVVSDCRFKNEFEGFPNAFRVRLKCREEIRKFRCTQWDGNQQHQS